MTILTHAVVAGAIGTQIGSPLLAAAAGFFSHFVLDRIPHNDYLYFYLEKKENPYLTKTSFFLLGLTSLFLIFEFNFSGRAISSPGLTASLFAILPDALTGLRASLNLEINFFDKFHNAVHFKTSLAEALHNKLGQREKAAPANRLAENFRLLKNSPWAKVGWAAEAAFEGVLLTLALVWWLT